MPIPRFSLYTHFFRFSLWSTSNGINKFKPLENICHKIYISTLDVKQFRFGWWWNTDEYKKSLKTTPFCFYVDKNWFVLSNLTLHLHALFSYWTTCSIMRFYCLVPLLAFYPMLKVNLIEVKLLIFSINFVRQPTWHPNFPKFDIQSLISSLIWNYKS